jgi:hypothetical protein
MFKKRKTLGAIRLPDGGEVGEAVDFKLKSPGTQSVVPSVIPIRRFNPGYALLLCDDAAACGE